MAATDKLSAEDKEFLEKCEDKLKDRYTDKDEEFMKVFNADALKPPIVESWWVPNNSGRRNDGRFNRQSQPYERQDYNNSRRGYNNHRRDNRNRRGYNDYNNYAHGHRNY
ncbi:uncharacterized protein ACR2FA_012109 isoform 2-T2 [Aphomia sociella]